MEPINVFIYIDPYPCKLYTISAVHANAQFATKPVNGRSSSNPVLLEVDFMKKPFKTNQIFGTNVTFRDTTFFTCFKESLCRWTNLCDRRPPLPPPPSPMPPPGPVPSQDSDDIWQTEQLTREVSSQKKITFYTI